MSARMTLEAQQAMKQQACLDPLTLNPKPCKHGDNTNSKSEYGSLRYLGVPYGGPYSEGVLLFGGSI